MPYEPTNWKSGDVVTSAKLNKIEGGIVSGGVLVVTDNEGTLDKTWQEIHDAAFAVIVFYPTETDKRYLYVTTTNVVDENAYAVGITDNDVYISTTANGYPVLSDE